MAIRAEDLPHFTPAQYRALVEAQPDLLAHTELLDGVIYHVSPLSPLHAAAVAELTYLLRERYGRNRLLAGPTVEFPGSEWEPDLVVIRDGTVIEDVEEAAGVYLAPNQLELAVEVSVSSLNRDLGVKLADYAQARVPAYWVLHPGKPGFLRRHTNPQHDTYRDVDQIELPGGYRDLKL